ncbi:Peptidase M16 inactive domain [Kingella potus]|uniref:Peptidase M16 inactive domain n=1 Tax=Kingella potus TaxID=265175 RepID=A0A377QZX4_9NEIS|nr:pitrilysin family protein [Kingella potus]UOP00891.1 insulinase family protein [Kingella potus]STR00542.1 Peptidase M16 inactive domain [Kingella potus]
MNKILLILPVFLAAAPIHAAPEFQRWQTKDGATVVLVERHGLPIVNIGITFKGAGQAGESEKGAASFTAAMLDSGSSKYSEEQLRDEANRLGVSIGSSAGVENAAVSFASLSRPQTLSDGLKLANQIIAHPVFDSAVLEREKKQAATALRQNLSNPAFAAARELAKLNYGSHPYANNARLEETDILAVSADTLKRHHRSLYAKNNAYIAIVGDLTRKQADTAAAALLDGLPDTAAVRDIPPAPAAAGRSANLPFSGKEQAAVAIGLPFAERQSPDRHALAVGNYILGGGGFDSRLMKTLRDEKGLVYGVSSGYTPLARKGPFAVSFTTKKSSAAEALAAARQVIADFVATGPTEAELRQAKDNITGSFPMSHDTNAKTVALAANIGVNNLPLNYYDRYTQQIEAVTAAQVRAAWQRRLDPAKANAVTVGAQ